MYLALQDSKKDIVKKKFQQNNHNANKLGSSRSKSYSEKFYVASQNNIGIRIVSTMMMLIVDVVSHVRRHTSRKQFIIDICLSLSGRVLDS